MTPRHDTHIEVPDLSADENLIDEESGLLDRKWSVSSWVALGDAAILDGDIITIDNERLVTSWRRVTSTEQMLEGFAGLLDASPKRIRRYAAKWGLLSLCSHGLWHGHGRTEVPFRLADPRIVVEIDTDCVSFGRDPVVMWRYWVAQSDAVLRIISRLRGGSLGRKADWSVLQMLGPWASRLPSFVEEEGVLNINRGPPDNIEGQRECIALVLETWIRLGGVGLQVEWVGTKASVGFGAPGLLGGIGLQLALVATGLERWAVCHACGSPYVPKKRRPRSDQRNYCPTCREAGAPTRDAKRDQRDRKRTPDVKHWDRRRTKPTV